MNKFAWTLLVVSTGTFLSNCGSKREEETLNLPAISQFASSPSDTFVLDSTGQAKVSRAFPFKGTGSACAHAGGHLHFTNTGAPYTADLFAPADGVIDRIEPCVIVGDNDRYGVSLAFAQVDGKKVSFEYSIEPMGGHLCSGGVEGADNGAFAPYILVHEGDSISKGQLIARMYKVDTGGDDSHLHFHLQTEDDSTFHCPNIFNTAVTSTFAGLYGSETCAGAAFGATFCYEPGPGENLLP